MSFGTRATPAPRATMVLATQTTLRVAPEMTPRPQMEVFDPQAIRARHFANDRAFSNTVALPRRKEQSEGARVAIILATTFVTIAIMLAVYGWATTGSINPLGGLTAMLQTAASLKAG